MNLGGSTAPSSGGGGQPQTPLAQEVDAAGFGLIDLGRVARKPLFLASGSYALANTTSVVITNAFTAVTVTLPSSPIVGQEIEFTAGVTSSLTILPHSGAIAGQGSISLTAGATVTLRWNGSTWLAVGISFFPFGTTTNPPVTNRAHGLTVPAAPFQPNQQSDCTIHFGTTAAGVISITVGPSDPPTEMPLYSSFAVAAGVPFSIPLPASWWVSIALSGGAALTTYSYVGS